MSTISPESLGNQIRMLRLTAGLTQQDLAERSGLSVRSISDLERSLRTAPRMETLRMLASALDLTAEQRASLLAAAHPELRPQVSPGLNIKSSSPSPEVSARETRRALPIPPTNLVGRQRDVSQLLTLFQTGDARLVTLIGPGGVGKTRLAIATAEIVQSHHPADVAFVDLTPVTEPGLTAAAITEALGLSGVANRTPIDALCYALEDRSLLLVLDNFEHVLDAAPVVSRILETCSNVRVIVTSRERLRLRGEYVFPVAPLALPTIDKASFATLSSIAEAPAVRLFLDRAMEVHRGTDLDNEDAIAIARICERLDGLPLAIELAASRMRYESAAVLLERLERRLPVLTGGPRDLPLRQQTLRNTIAWSYDLLPPGEQALFRFLCVFPGGFTLDAATSIAGRQAIGRRQEFQPELLDPEGQASSFDTVVSLLDNSLIQRQVPLEQPARFSILESVREFGLELLAEHDEAQTARHQFVSWLVSLTDEPRLEALDGYVGTGTFSLPGEQDNLRLALAISMNPGDLRGAVRIALSLSPLWWEHGLFTEARASLDRILTSADALDPVLHGIVLGWAAEWAWLQSDYRRTRDLSSAALSICREVGHEPGAAANLYRLGRVATAWDPPVASSLLREALDLNRRLGNDREAAWTLIGMGYAAMTLTELPSAEDWIAQATDLLKTLEDPIRGGLAVSCEQARAWIAFLKNDVDRAEQMLAQSLVDSHEQRYEYGECNALRLLGRVARERGDLKTSATLHLEALRLSQQQGTPRRECYCLLELASIAQVRGQSTLATRLLGAEASLREQPGHLYTPDEQQTQTWTSAAARQVLGETAFIQAWKLGERQDWNARLAQGSLVKASF